MKKVLLLVILLSAAASGVTPGLEARKVRAPAPDDETLLSTVLTRISGRPGLDVSAVTVSAAGGTLLLSGTVATLFDRGEVERLASGVRGVAAIDNRVEIMKLDEPDASFEVAADRALGALPRLKGFRIQVSVSNGVLTLQGEVPLARDRLDAEDSVSRVAGILSVRNLLHLPLHPTSPELIRKRIDGLLHNRLVFGAVENLEVGVTPEGEVTLEGVVATQADRLRAERLSYGLRGVVTVVNRLVVRTVDAPRP